MFQFAIIVRGDADMDTNYDADSCLQFCMQTLFSSYAAALEIMSVMEEDKGRNENFRRERVKKICSRELADMLLKTPRLQHTALTAENEVGLSLGFCCVAVIAGWDDEALLLCQESPLCTIKGVTMQVTPEPLCYERTGIHTPEQAITLSATRRCRRLWRQTHNKIIVACTPMAPLNAGSNKSNACN